MITETECKTEIPKIHDFTNVNHSWGDAWNDRVYKMWKDEDEGMANGKAGCTGTAKINHINNRQK